MRSLKIALLSRWLWEENRRDGNREGGMVQQLAEAVAAQGHEVVVLSQSPQVDRLEKSQIGKLETWLSPREKKYDFFTGLRDKLAKQIYGHRKVHSDALALRDFLVQRGPFDVLWAQSEEPDGLVVGVAAQMGIPLPPVLTQIHSLRYRFNHGSTVFTGKAALSVAFRHATRIIANSNLVADSLPAYACAGLNAEQLRAKVRVVYPNLVHDFLRAAENTEALPAAEPGRVLFFGALNEKKGALTFLEAIVKTEAAKTNANFAVAGNFTEKNPRFTRRWNELLGITRRALPGTQFELLGKIPPTEVIRQVARASVVVLPSLFDEFSRALVESLSLGRPVITTKQVGAWPLVNEYVCGLVVEPNDPVALARAIDDILHPQAHYEANARQVARRLIHEFSPGAIARQIAHHLSEIAAPLK